MSNTHFPITPMAGVKFDTPTDTAQFALGTICQGSDGTEWVYVQAGAALVLGDCVGITEDFVATGLTLTTANDSDRLGFAQVAFSSNQYGWVALRGSNIKCRVKAACAADAQLWTTASAGVLDDATAANAEKVDGIVMVAANGAATAAVECKASWPHLRES